MWIVFKPDKLCGKLPYVAVKTVREKVIVNNRSDNGRHWRSYSVGQKYNDVHAFDKPAVVTYNKVKRCKDLCLGGCIFIFVSPVLALCIIAIKLDSKGPVFFPQKRTGKGGRKFRMYKFRTMVVNANELKEHYQHLNTLTYPDFKIPNDPRITRVGRFLRKSSLDEFPQLLNVLRGDMSLVGPRPTSFCSSTYDLWQTARLGVKPGITGLWQVSGRANIDFDERARLDIEYIRNQSFWYDIKILFRTFRCVLKRDGAT
jgi:lipopolysaccharide/colanic/teichoic acid biosynthesis glycosyltransferase